MCFDLSRASLPFPVIKMQLTYTLAGCLVVLVAVPWFECEGYVAIAPNVEIRDGEWYVRSKLTLSETMCLESANSLPLFLVL